MTQKNSGLAQELKELRAEVQALTKAQAAAAEAAAADAATAEEEEVATAVEAEADAGSLDFQELVDLLKQEVEDMNPLTCLAVFGLGVLTGRLLSR